MMTAEALANIMNDLFANVVYAGIDTDKHKYPIGEICNGHYVYGWWLNTEDFIFYMSI